MPIRRRSFHPAVTLGLLCSTLACNAIAGSVVMLSAQAETYAGKAFTSELLPMGSGKMQAIATTCPQQLQTDRDQSISRSLGRSKAILAHQPDLALAHLQSAVKLALAAPQMTQRRSVLNRLFVTAQSGFGDAFLGDASKGGSGLVSSRLALLETTHQLVQSLDSGHSLAKTRTLMALARYAQALKQPQNSPASSPDPAVVKLSERASVRVLAWLTEAIATSQTIQNKNRSEQVVLAQTLIDLSQTILDLQPRSAKGINPGTIAPAIAPLLARAEALALSLPTTPPRPGAGLERSSLLRSLATLYINSGQVQAAERLAKLDPDQANQIGLDLAEWDLKQGNLDRALARFKAAPNPSLTHGLWLPVHISAAYLKLGQTAKAEAAFQEAVRLQERGSVDIPSSREFLADVLYFYIQAGQPAEAQKRLSQLSTPEVRREILWAIASGYAKAGQLSLVDPVLQQLLQGATPGSEVERSSDWLRITAIRDRLGQTNLADQAFSQALDFAQKMPEVDRENYLRGSLSNALLYQPQPFRFTLRLLQLRPNATQAETLANQAIAQNDLNTALQASQLLSLNYPAEKFRPLLQIITTYAQQGQIDRALQLAQTLQNLGQAPYQTQALIAISRTLTNKPDQAKTLRQQALTSRANLTGSLRSQADIAIALEFLRFGQPISQIVTEPKPNLRAQLLLDYARDAWVIDRRTEAIALLREARGIARTLPMAELAERDRLLGEIALTFAQGGQPALATETIGMISTPNQSAIRTRSRCYGAVVTGQVATGHWSGDSLGWFALSC